jgi:hypothetical protein
LRIVIDTPDEGNNQGENPNYVDEAWSPDFS